MPNPSKKAQGSLSRRFSEIEKRLSRIENEIGIRYEEPVQVQKADALASMAQKSSSSQKRSSSQEDFQVQWFKVFGAVGFILILLGLFYLYRWGVEQGILTYGVRVFLGLLAGIGLIVFGERMRVHSVKNFGEMIVGGGIAMTYFTVYATYYFPAVRAALGTSLLLNSLLLLLVSAAAVWLAFRSDSMIMTSFAFFLGYATTFLLPQGNWSIITGLIISAGLWAVLWIKKWNYGFAPALAAWMVVFINIGSTMNSEGIGIASTYLAITFALFTALAFRYSPKDDGVSISVVVINSLCTLIAGLTVVAFAVNKLSMTDFSGSFVFIFAAVHILLWTVALSQGKSSISNAFLLTAIALIAVGIPIQLDKAWITILWATQGGLLMFLGLKYDHLGIRISAYVVLGFTALKSLLVDIWNIDGGERLLTMLFVCAVLILSAFMLQRRSDLMRKYGMLAPNAVTIAAVAMTALTFMMEFTSSKGFSALSGFSSEMRLTLLTVSWCVLALVSIVVGLKSGVVSLRSSGYILSLITALKVLTTSLLMQTFGARTLTLLFLVATFAAISYLMRSQASLLTKDERSIGTLFGFAALIAGTITLAVELLDAKGLLEALTSGQRQTILSVIWGAESLALIYFGIGRDNAGLRTAGLILFGVTVGKFLIIDLRNLVTVYRIVISLIMGGIALGASFYYARHKERFSKIIK